MPSVRTGFDDVLGATHGARRPVERGDESVTGGVDLGSAEAPEGPRRGGFFPPEDRGSVPDRRR